MDVKQVNNNQQGESKMNFSAPLNEEQHQLLVKSINQMMGFQFDNERDNGERMDDEGAIIKRIRINDKEEIEIDRAAKWVIVVERNQDGRLYSSKVFNSYVDFENAYDLNLSKIVHEWSVKDGRVYIENIEVLLNANNQYNSALSKIQNKMENEARSSVEPL